MIVADRHGLAAMSLSEVTFEAGVAKGTFFVHFDDRASLIVTLHRTFHDDLFAQVLTSTAGMAPGVDRAISRSTAFLDGCRKRPGVRSLLMESRDLSDIRAEVRKRNAEAMQLILQDLRASQRRAYPEQTARLLVAATIEVAGAELEAKRSLPTLRSALFALFN
jgi:TetR/AcrR family transcriptional regulator, transcriptional repressor for nem operon